jgi:hypothetical protein
MEDAVSIEANVATNEATTELEHVLGLSVETPDQRRVALETLKQLSERHRSLDKRRKELTAPIDESKKRIIALFREPLTKLEAAIDRLKVTIGRYDQDVQQARAAAMAEATAALAKGDHATANSAIMQAFGGESGAIDGSYNRTDWKFEIVDAFALPREYLQPNVEAIGAVVRSTRGAVAIPGVRVWSETKPVVRTGGGVS